MSTIAGVTGPISRQKLGIVLTHEHPSGSFVSGWVPPEGSTASSLNPYSPAQRHHVATNPHSVRDISDLPGHIVLEELSTAHGLGVRTVVDVTPIGMGRNVHYLQLLSRSTGMQLLCSTAFYVERRHPELVAYSSEGEIRDLFVAELEVGIGGTDVKAAVIGEIGCSNEITSEEVKVLRAAAAAHHVTGAPISLHRSSFPSEMGSLSGLHLLLDLGVDPERIVFSHCDERPSATFALEVLRAGCYASLDTFGFDAYWRHWRRDGRIDVLSTDSDRHVILGQLLDEGHLRRLLISQDVCYKPQAMHYGGGGYSHILQTVAPRLEAEQNMTKADLDTLLIHNAADWLLGPDRS